MGGNKRKYSLKAGDRFGRWTVIEKADSVIYNDRDERLMWLCRCDCGTERVVSEQALVHGQSKSCGCTRSDNPRFGMKKHGQARTKLYSVYSGMIQRCFNANNPNYKNYGERGITVCQQWLGEDGFIHFYKWAMANGYSDQVKVTLDRINVNGNYEPTNCRWADYVTQANNMRSNRLITYNGETHTISEWARLKGIKTSTLNARIRSEMPTEKALSTEKWVWQKEHRKLEREGRKQ